jgi:hypothetical protein
MPSSVPPPSTFQLVLWWTVYLSPLLNVVIIAITAIILLWYTYETHRLRKTAQAQSQNLEKQIAVSQQQVQVTQQQIEVMRRPFVMVDPYSLNNSLVRFDVSNIGNSAAINIEVIAGPVRLKIHTIEIDDTIIVNVFERTSPPVDTEEILEIYAHAKPLEMENSPSLLLSSELLSQGLLLEIKYYNVAMVQYFTTMLVFPSRVSITASGTMIPDSLPSLPVVHT